MTRRVRFQQSDVTRMLKAAKAAGYEKVHVILRPTGDLEMFLGSDWPKSQTDNEWADLE